MAAAIPVSHAAASDGKVMPGMIQPGNAVLVHHYGSYEKMGNAYSAIHQYIAKNNKKVTGPSWEIYMVAPGAEKDTAKWRTDIYFPVE